MRPSSTSTPAALRILLLLLVSICCGVVQSFRASVVVVPSVARSLPSSSRCSACTRLLSSTADQQTATTASPAAAIIAAAEEDEETSGKRPLARDRYVATNRFTVRPGRGAKFEKRWADRKSRLASLDGFKYFHLMRRVDVDGASNSGELLVPPSVSCWEERSHTNNARSGIVGVDIWTSASY